ncbi:hypothetical protein CERSUDRAFT_83897 [Gelatoporia subvermispora B]|uniref:Endonuclease/exonuclease/phosphatase domain-containing protein n=1 Tax=Ceriporiopsis subvermispora (strain B) TaxID=914234 RepID=M2PKQ1_CERS8|nr:hypothetical protein CERSUDRAFT_83897 [Gelatoporia subvermispora B]
MQITAPTPAPRTFRVATYNLRYDSQPDNKSVAESLAELPDPLAAPRFFERRGEQPWSLRRLKVAQQLLSEDLSVIGFQEALVRQVHDLQELLGDDWAWIGVGRDDGVEAGEFSPIFYRKSRLSLISHEHFWLSNTPFEPSRYPGAGSHRVCTAAHFSLHPPFASASRTNFTLLNTHLDDRSDPQRRLGASLLLARARHAAHSTHAPVLVLGDFNSPGSGFDSGAYAIATGARAPVSLPPAFAARYTVPDGSLPNFVLRDMRAETPRLSIAGHWATYTGFGRPGEASGWTRIDFVFGGSNGGWTAQAYKVGDALTDDGVLASDHRPVFVDISFQ